ncbi:hypothetical protein LJK87_48235 [Paenibacillus sp. P25]|nr:hypothetical protein LJK87_48235 [Paenibacillus sp. P25]
MIRRLLTVFLLAVCVPAVGLLSQPTPCEACSCRTPALDEAVSRSGSVFAGKVLEIKWVPDPYESNGALAYKHAVRFEVERTFKGPDTSQIIVNAGAGKVPAASILSKASPILCLLTRRSIMSW